MNRLALFLALAGAICPASACPPDPGPGESDPTCPSGPIAIHTKTCPASIYPGGAITAELDCYSHPGGAACSAYPVEDVPQGHLRYNWEITVGGTHSSFPMGGPDIGFSCPRHQHAMVILTVDSYNACGQLTNSDTTYESFTCGNAVR